MSHRFLTTFLCLWISVSAMAQRTISDAKITYRMDLPPEMAQTDAMLQNSSLTIYMRSYLSRVEINFNIVNYVYLINSRERTMTTLIDQHGSRYLIRNSKEQFDKDMKQYEGTKFADQAEKKEIAGYTCKKALATMPDGKTYVLYYTPDLVPENRLYNQRFTNLKGLVLEYEIHTKTGSTITVTATKVELIPVPASYFDVPRSGYKEVSQQELKNMN
ncbi:hypothetical protein [Chitinophaga sp. sic0106]|uniref:hypothetical protein n=1 Tax=Chitinophaga sp. sic0106 TaxID=2854785 RepID=UPI001C43975E|nr:hypothetical protein [Chitinophaga sp. sic0106]MBV7533592.1 hypothetical protein [Chitinophaga sp. sic0106]